MGSALLYIYRTIIHGVAVSLEADSFGRILFLYATFVAASAFCVTKPGGMGFTVLAETSLYMHVYVK